MDFLVHYKVLHFNYHSTRGTTKKNTEYDKLTDSTSNEVLLHVVYTPCDLYVLDTGETHTCTINSTNEVSRVCIRLSFVIVLISEPDQ